MHLELEKHIYSKALVKAKVQNNYSFCKTVRADNLIYNNMRYTWKKTILLKFPKQDTCCAVQ